MSFPSRSPKHASGQASNTTSQYSDASMSAPMPVGSSNGTQTRRVIQPLLGRDMNTVPGSGVAVHEEHKSQSTTSHYHHGRSSSQSQLHSQSSPSRSAHGQAHRHASSISSSAQSQTGLSHEAMTNHDQPSPKRIRFAVPVEQPQRTIGVAKGSQVVYFSSPYHPSPSPSLPLAKSDVSSKIHRIHFKDSPNDECLVSLPNYFDTPKPIPLCTDKNDDNDNIVILPVGGPSSNITSPYPCNLDFPIRITVSSGCLTGLGMFAKRPIRRGEVVLVERAVMIVAESSESDSVDKVIRELKEDVKVLVGGLTDAVADGMMKTQKKSAQGILNSNAFEVELGGQKCKALFLKSARCNHSCGPSVIPTFNANTLTLTLHANRDLRPGDEITIPYLSVFALSSSSPSYSLTSTILSAGSPPTSPPTILGQFTSLGSASVSPFTSPSGVSTISISTSTSTSTSTSATSFSSLSSLSSLSQASDQTLTTTPPLYLPRHSRRRLLQQLHNFECRCEHCDIPWSQADGVHKSDRARKELALYSLVLDSTSSPCDPDILKLRKKLAIPTFQEWCCDSRGRIPWDVLINTHKRLLDMRVKEGLELIGLGNPGVVHTNDQFSSASHADSDSDSAFLDVKKEPSTWLKHVDALAMCYGALADSKEFTKWLKKARDVRSGMTRSFIGGIHGERWEKELVANIQVLDSWLEEPKAFALWGLRAYH